MLVGLPEADARASWVLQHGHASGIKNVERRGQNPAAQLRAASGGSVGAFDGNVQVPVGRNAVRELVGAKCATCRGVASFDLENGVNLVGADGKVLRGPPKDLGIKILGGSLVGGGELDPGKCARDVFFDGRHRGESVLPRGDRGKGRSMGSGKIEIGRRAWKQLAWRNNQGKSNPHTYHHTRGTRSSRQKVVRGSIQSSTGALSRIPRR